MGPQYQATVGSFAASPQAQEPQQATQTPGNQTPGKALEQSPVHDGFGTRSGMYDNGMDVSAQPAPVVTPPQPQNQPATAGVNPSWAQQGRKRGGRAKRADGGPLAAFKGPISPYMMTGDTLAALGQQANPMAGNVAPPAGGNMMPPQQQPQPQSYQPSLAEDYAAIQTPQASLYNKGLSNQDFLNQVYQQALGRAPDVGGQEFWANQLASGQSQQDVENAILASPEERSRQFMDQLYQSSLGRAPDAPGQQYWTELMASGKLTPDQVQAEFLKTPELQRNLAQGIAPDRYGQVDPFVAGYNARMANAQANIGGIAQGNVSQNTADLADYQKQLQQVQDANQQRLAAAQQARSERQAREAEAARQQALAVALMMMMKH